MPAVHCPICVSDLTIDKIVVFPCGHGLCIDCKKVIFEDSARPKCPNCRVKIRDQDVHPVFLELVDTKVAFLSSLVDGLDKMDHKSPLPTIEKVGQTLGKVLQDPQSEPNATTALTKAVKDLNERIIPLFTKVEDQSHKITALRKAFLDSHREAENFKNQLAISQADSIELAKELKKTKKNENKAIHLAEIAKNDLGEVQERLVQWKKLASKLIAENNRYKDLLEKQVESGGSRGEKQRKLQKKVPVGTQKDHDGVFSKHSLMRNSLDISQDENRIDLDREGRFPFDYEVLGTLKRRKENNIVHQPLPANMSRFDLPTNITPSLVLIRDAAGQIYCTSSDCLE